MALLLDQLFAPLPDNNEIATKTFLESVSHLPPFFDCLGSKVFAPIKADINGNITVSLRTKSCIINIFLRIVSIKFL
uniref:Glycolipid transfer protein domain-containing protein n=1 Tax=Cyprinus carpio TaxID=7962 RepID=A0A8C2HM75_CYPCA